MTRGGWRWVILTIAKFPISNICALCPRGVLPLRASDHLHWNLWCRTSAHLLHRSGTHPGEQPLNNILNIDCAGATAARVNQHQCGKEHATGLGIISPGGRGWHGGTVAGTVARWHRGSVRTVGLGSCGSSCVKTVEQWIIAGIVRAATC